MKIGKDMCSRCGKESGQKYGECCSSFQAVSDTDFGVEDTFDKCEDAVACWVRREKARICTYISV